MQTGVPSDVDRQHSGRTEGGNSKQESREVSRRRLLYRLSHRDAGSPSRVIDDPQAGQPCIWRHHRSE
jgi:hypothetical protein